MGNAYRPKPPVPPLPIGTYTLLLLLGLLLLPLAGVCLAVRALDVGLYLLYRTLHERKPR